MNFKKYHVSRNLFDYQTMALSLSGYYLNASGQEIALSGWRISDYIPCNGTEFTINKIGGNTPAICLYDENKQFLAGKSYQTGGTTNKEPVTISSETNAKYIRFSYVTLSDNLSEIMLNTGSAALPYEPYSSEVWHDIPHYIYNAESETWQEVTDVHERSSGQWD